MTSTITQALTKEEFLKLPETKPAREYINGDIVQKPMPRGKDHLKGRLRGLYPRGGLYSATVSD